MGVEVADEAEKEAKKAEARNDIAEEKSNVIPVSNKKAASPVVQKIAGPAIEKSSGGSTSQDVLLAQVEAEKRLALIKAWEESEKTKAENKAYKKFSAVGSWENRRKASVDAELKQIEEKWERKKAEYEEKMKKKIAEIHQVAEEKKAMVEAKRREDFLKAEDKAAKFRASGYKPKRFFACFSS
ncbi:Remorin [Quillaja saponaria]|uniref:Remorin n=1 Tax=Quillaja saponaria TaxID=32244 RepID=A0AAD7L6A0_QUISA|nr:Remorin [Quillaja saponaria]